MPRDELKPFASFWLVLVAATVFVTCTNIDFERVSEFPTFKFTILMIFELAKNCALSYIILLFWIKLYKYFHGDIKKELVWFSFILVFLFSTETLALFAKQVLKSALINVELNNSHLETTMNKARSERDALREELKTLTATVQSMKEYENED